MKKYLLILVLLCFSCAGHYVTREELKTALETQARPSVVEIEKALEDSATSARAYTAYEGTGTGALGKTPCTSLTDGDQAWVQTGVDTAFYTFDATDTNSEDTVNKTYIHCYDASWSAGNWVLSPIRGLIINTDVQAYDADLADLADGSLSGGKVGTGISGTNISTGTVADARVASTIARYSMTQDLDANNNDILDVGVINPTDIPGLTGKHDTDAENVFFFGMQSGTKAATEADTILQGFTGNALSTFLEHDGGTDEVTISKDTTVSGSLAATDIDAGTLYDVETSGRALTGCKEIVYYSGTNANEVFTLPNEPDCDPGVSGKVFCVHNRNTGSFRLTPQSTDRILRHSGYSSCTAGQYIGSIDGAEYVCVEGRGDGATEYWQLTDYGASSVGDVPCGGP